MISLGAKPQKSIDAGFAVGRRIAWIDDPFQSLTALQLNNWVNFADEAVNRIFCVEFCSRLDLKMIIAISFGPGRGDGVDVALGDGIPAAFRIGGVLGRKSA